MANDDLARRSVLWAERKGSSSVDDADARMVRQSLLICREDTDDGERQPLFAGREEAKPNTSPSASYLAPDEAEVDDSITAHARVAAKYEDNRPKSPPRTKVMTPSQFEHYRHQKELRRSESDASHSDDEDAMESDFDQEDEAERNRQAEKQRRKQQAHLTVYRQQMMKVTGRQSPPLLSLRPDGSNLAPPSPSLRPRTAGSENNEGDDDEEIPLGILAAHGFPNKNRPPTHLASPASIPNLRASFQPPFVQQQQPEKQPGNDANRAGLPAFAKNLPRDPYFGSSLVNLSNRESLAMGGGNTSPPHPSGLVGVIATEERARAWRRSAADMPHSLNNMISGVPRPYTMMQPMPSATDQAQVQLSQQMTNMMQVQMQMMQHLVCMQGGQSSASLSLATPSPPPHVRPTSQVPPMHNRSMSTLNPGMATWGNGPSGPDYAQSIAPSERSNVGLASRYRPVTSGPVDQGRMSTFTSSPALKPWDDAKRNTVMTPPPGQRPLEKANINTTIRPKSSYAKSRPRNGGSDDENDDAAWAEMMKKREKKKNNWKMKRETTTGDLFNNPN